MGTLIGEKTPNFGVSEWVQGGPTNFAEERGHIVLLEVFQVNCPGCFMRALPEAVDLYNRYKDDGVRVLGLATAFEDFDLNTLDNLKKLAKTGEVVGETKSALTAHDQLQEGNRLSFEIPFPLAMDRLTKSSGEISEEQVMQFIYGQLPNFDPEPEEYKTQIIKRVKEYLKSKEYTAETFDNFALQGTPSTILVDKKGILRDVSFGRTGHVEPLIQRLLNED